MVTAVLAILFLLAGFSNLPRQEKLPPRKWGLLHPFRIGPKGDPYLWRLSLVTTPWGSAKLHLIFRPDRQRDLHDHPWSFVGLVLLGWYEEAVPHCNWKRCSWRGSRKIRWVNRKVARTAQEEVAERRLSDTHAISALHKRLGLPVVTFLLCGPRFRQWGFVVKGKWVSWREYGQEA